MKIDNFMLSMFQTCPIKYQLRIRQGWTVRRKSAALGFGGALHEGLAEWYRTKDPVRALQAIHERWPTNVPIDDYRTREKCIGVMSDYIRTYHKSDAFSVVGAPDNPMIECTFTLPLGKFLDCETCGVHPLEDGHCPKCGTECEEIEYGGIFDGLIEFNGSVYVFEHKSTSQMGSYYFNQFKPNNQVTGYIWAAGHLSGKRVGGALINAIGVYKSSATKFERSITSRSSIEIEEWRENVRSTCQQIRDCERRGHWPMHTGSCTQYGLCEFHSVHTLSTEKERQKLLEQDYIQDPWVFEDRDDAKGAAE